MAIPKILQQLRGGFRIPDQVNQMIRMFKSGDPQAVLNQLMMTNPNMKQVMGIVEQYGGDWGVFLAKPLKKDYEAETVVAQHNQTNTHLYLYAGALSGKLEEYGSEIKWWPGAVRFSVVILGKSPVELKDIKLELYPAKSKK